MLEIRTVLVPRRPCFSSKKSGLFFSGILGGVESREREIQICWPASDVKGFLLPQMASLFQPSHIVTGRFVTVLFQMLKDYSAQFFDFSQGSDPTLKGTYEKMKYPMVWDHPIKYIISETLNLFQTLMDWIGVRHYVASKKDSLAHGQLLVEPCTYIYICKC